MDLPRLELGFPGTALREALVSAVLDGRKTTTTGLLADYEACGDPIPEPGDRYALVGPDETVVGVVEVVAASVVPIRDVDLQHVRDEGEGDRTIAQWRAGHVRFFESAGMREALGDPRFTVDDDTLVVLERFRLVPN